MTRTTEPDKPTTGPPAVPDARAPGLPGSLYATARLNTPKPGSLARVRPASPASSPY